jgi:hypothetical protein
MKYLHPSFLVSRALLALGCLAAVLSGCGGGVGTGGTGSFASGPITGFGSVIVNDVRFDDSMAGVEDGDGASRTRDELLLGMTVEVDSSAIVAGTTNSTATASRIRFDSVLLGPVLALDLAGSSFTVLGQRVAVDTNTVFAEALGGFSSLVAGRMVEVFGVYDAAAARYRATRVSAAANNETLRIRGLVSLLDTPGQTLSIAGVSFAYAGATGIPVDLAIGQFVRLRLASQQLAGRWVVKSFGTAVRSLPDGDDAKLKGLINSLVSATSFSVDGRAVDATDASFPDGRLGLAVGVRVEVEGHVRSGVLRALKVSIKTDQQERDREFELHGAIEAVDAAQRTISLRRVTVSTARPDLLYEDGTAAKLTVGRRVQVKGLLSADRLRIEALLIRFE